MYLLLGFTYKRYMPSVISFRHAVEALYLKGVGFLVKVTGIRSICLITALYMG